MTLKSKAARVLSTSKDADGDKAMTETYNVTGHSGPSYPAAETTNPALILGGVVRLKSGGPEMTIIEMRGTARVGYTVLCQWFDGGRLDGCEFPPEALESK